MTLNMKMLRAIVAGVAGIAAALSVVTAGGQPGAAACQRSVAIDPQATVSEAGRSLTFVVYTGDCAVAGSVSFTVTDGTARRDIDFVLNNGRLQWDPGDLSSRRVTATILGDSLAETPLEDFRVTLVSPSPGIRIASAAGQGRIFDDDTRDRLATVDSRICLVVSQGETTGCSPSPAGGLSTMNAGIATFEPGHIINVPVILNAPNGTDQSATFDTSDGNLFGGLDYVPVHRTVLIPAGAFVVLVPVRLLPHAYTQSGKHFNTHVSSYTAGGTILGTGQVTVVH